VMEIQLRQADNRQARCQQRLIQWQRNVRGDQNIQVMRQDLVKQVGNGDDGQLVQRRGNLEENQLIPYVLVGVDDRLHGLDPIGIGWGNQYPNAGLFRQVNGF